MGLVLRSGLIAQLLAALDTGDIDVVLGPVHPDLPSRHAAQPLFTEELVLVTSPGHPLARSRRVTLAAVREEPFICLPAGSGLRAILDAAAASAGIQLQVPFETHSPHSIRELVSVGLGVALLARSAAAAIGPPIMVHPLPPAPAHPPVGLIHHRDHRLTPAAQAFRGHLQRFATLPPGPEDPGTALARPVAFLQSRPTYGTGLLTTGGSFTAHVREAQALRRAGPAHRPDTQNEANR